MRPLAAVPLLCAALALGACTSDSTTESAPEAAEQPTETASSSTAPTRPEVGECHQLSLEELLGSADTDPAVPCGEEHTSETVHVGTFTAAAAGETETLTQDRANRVAARTCRTEAASYLGTEPGPLWLTRVEVFWFVPTPEEVDAGADWLRCDVVVLERGERLMQLPRSMQDALRADRGGRYALCGTARPGSKDFERVVCGERHSWRAISMIGVGDGERYPGAQAARSAGQDRCQAQARAAQGGALQYDYGWEWPTEAQWKAGQRHGYCWAPA